ncbi:hypothetical protein B0H15DRAFT_843972 [Mycena belliarum]|uniref:Uncharacterized protein n=1 Tax=Mycena belliarum TaxID=1033014 RepID=A0AAD6U387_9AGAR|nr:hypothetical protein B0H15DRAFT_843972 [Mycena belliae]
MCVLWGVCRGCADRCDTDTVVGMGIFALHLVLDLQTRARLRHRLRHRDSRCTEGGGTQHRSRAVVRGRYDLRHTLLHVRPLPRTPRRARATPRVPPCFRSASASAVLPTSANASLDVAAARRKSTRTRAHPRHQSHWPHRRRGRSSAASNAQVAVDAGQGQGRAVKPAPPLIAADARLPHPSLDLNTYLRYVCAPTAYIHTNSCAALPTSPAPSPPPPDPSRPPRASSRRKLPSTAPGARLGPDAACIWLPTPRPFRPLSHPTARPPVPRTQRRPRIHGPVSARGSGS